MASSHRSVRLYPAVVSLALLAGVAACRDGGRSGGAGGDDLRRYTVRAEIVSLPGAGPRQMSLRHEAIDDLADASGKVVGMGSMVMPFEVAPAVALDDLKVGDKVEVRLAVGWTPSVLRVEQVRKLPADTALEFRAARPPGTRP